MRSASCCRLNSDLKGIVRKFENVYSKFVVSIKISMKTQIPCPKPCSYGKWLIIKFLPSYFTNYIKIPPCNRLYFESQVSLSFFLPMLFSAGRNLLSVHHSLCFSCSAHLALAWPALRDPPFRNSNWSAQSFLHLLLGLWAVSLKLCKCLNQGEAAKSLCNKQALVWDTW